MSCGIVGRLTTVKPTRNDCIGSTTTGSTTTGSTTTTGIGRVTRITVEHNDSPYGHVTRFARFSGSRDGSSHEANVALVAVRSQLVTHGLTNLVVGHRCVSKGGSRRTRTSNPRFRRPVLYPIEP